MEPSGVYKSPHCVNPLVVGKIMEYATARRAAFLKDFEALQPLSVEAYALILEWMAVTSETLSGDDLEILYQSNVWRNLEEKYQEVDVQCRYNLLKVIKISASIDAQRISYYSFVSDELKAEAFEMIVQGCLMKGTTENLSSLLKYTESKKVVDLLIKSDNEKLRICILRSLSLALKALPVKNSVVAEIRKFIMCGEESRILEMLMFLHRPVMLDAPEDLQGHISDVIYRMCTSDDPTVRKQAFLALRKSIECPRDASEDQISASNSFLAILNAVEQNQTHLMAPAIKMLPQIESMPLKWRKILLESILRNHNRVILSSTLEYLMSSECFFTVLEDLLPHAFSALNQASFHREESEIAREFCLQIFKWNWRVSLDKFAEVSWLPYPLHAILTYVNAPGIICLDTSHHSSMGAILGKIMSNISSLQTDQESKKTLFMALRNFIENVEKFLSAEDKEVILKKITETSPGDSAVLQLYRTTFKNPSSTSPDLLSTGNLVDIFRLVNDFPVEALVDLAKRLSENSFTVSDSFAQLFLEHFNTYTIKERFITLLTLKFSAIPYERDICKTFIRRNFTVDVQNVCSSKDFNLCYENLLVEQIVRIIEWSSGKILPNVSANEILMSIRERLERSEDFCSTVNLFKILKYLRLDDGDKELLGCLLEVAYREMMSYKGRSQFAPSCAAFVDSFPTNVTPIDDTMKKILEEVSLNSPEIFQAIYEKLEYISDELFAKLLSLREGVQLSLIKRNSPLRDFQMKTVEFAVDYYIDADILNSLVTMYSELSKSKAMYYPNSNHHLDKLRIVQGIAAILHHRHYKSIWRSEFLDFLFNEANQPSILYILELIVAHTIPTESVDQLIEVLKTPEKLKMHSAQSIFCILYLLCRKKRCTEFSRKCFSAIYPWIMGQNFSCRLYAQIALLKIHQLIEDIQPHEQTIHDAIKFSFHQLSGNPAKNSERLQKDFRFNRLNINSLLSPTYIFRDIPRITGVVESEIVPMCSGEEDLVDVVHPWQEKQTLGTVSVQETYENIQTKIIPPGEETKSSGLVVCASLVENHPNLGGLARTCEILGAQRLVLNSLRDIENSQFLALSMSAEKWLMFEEVKKWQLHSFCAEMKRQGYTIVGAEQTSKSVKLSGVAFPEKTLLVLGHEKEGLPADIIAGLDMAVEIPQIGRLRSLNVHVTGSIFAYEYAKQHLL